MHRRCCLSLLAGVALWLPAAPVLARETIAVHGGWAAFRDATPRRCFAVAEPAQTLRGSGWRPFAAVTIVPNAGRQGQINIRLRHRKLRGAPVFLSIGARRFQLIAGGSDAWARDAAQDEAIIAAMRGAPSMSIETRAQDGRAFADVYRLRGAATAIDAATLACLPPR
jgi:hypothetical protein